MRRFSCGLLLALVFLATIGSARASLIYDFASPGATALDGLDQGALSLTAFR